MFEFDTVIVEDETGGYVAFVPALPGCHTQGDTLGELMRNIKEAIELYLETLAEEEEGGSFKAEGGQGSESESLCLESSP
ncbi:type II toxin-antitoxin system HicB family antitoxin [Candidatus Hecatella orcuttiae]|jgi:predicted RNase H-like HicB family nuclease|uniref:type II toxin-antitoxin system HicB family antitoxin n=1 Tax=Candidatus Hecatella orcuttiae TaxID=1935119 RepID=UPI0028681476|nr:type II toxin-antitoxin system HicB family antitoxin [Candidatus Hecatella orcuttiae]